MFGIYIQVVYVIVRAFQTKEEAIIVISKNNGGFANVFNKNLELQKHMSICEVNCQLEDIEKSTISSKVLTTLSNTFPNYIFNYADMMNVNGVSMSNLVMTGSQSPVMLNLSTDQSLTNFVVL